MRPTMILKVLLFALVVSIASAKAAAAATIFSFTEVGGNVELTVSGSIDLNATFGLGGTSGSNQNLVVWPAGGNILVGTVGGVFYDYYGTPAWTPFGPGDFTFFSSSTGDRIALFSDPFLGVPTGYISGDPLSASATMLGATFASLGMTPGSYVTVLTNGQFTDTVTVNVGVESAAVPEPGTFLLFGTGLAAVVAARRWRSKTRA